jgi:membrane-bound metal-dependent hydrolase YbcI (DUF457 family)
MDALSHALLGFIAGQALQLDPNLQLLLIISSVSLDIDALSLQSPEAAFRTHRGPLHSILAAIAASLLIATGYTIFMRLPVASLESVVLICLAGLLSHIFLDVFTIGTMTALWPFSRRNFALNLTHFLDPTLLAALLVAALFITYTKTDVSAVQLVTGATLAFLALNLGARYYEQKRAAKIVIRLDGATSETMSLPTVRPDRWWTIKKTPFESGYHYEIYRVDPFRNRILEKDTVESTYTRYNGPAEPPIDSPEKAVACSKKDKRISAAVDRFVLPAVSVTHSKEDDMWQVFWHDAFTYAVKREHRGILAHIKVDGTITTEARWPHTTPPLDSSSAKNR